MQLTMVEYLKASGVPRTSLYTSFYFETPKTPQKTDDGSYVIQFAILPDGSPHTESHLMNSKAVSVFSRRHGSLGYRRIFRSEKVDWRRYAYCNRMAKYS